MRVVAGRLVGWRMVPVLALAVTSLGAGGRDLRLVDAAKKADTVAVRALLKQGAAVNEPYGDGTTALHWATHWNDLDMADLLMRAGANVNAVTDLGATSLYLASEVGSAAMAEKLLAAGANPNLVASTGVSPLMLAARAGGVEAVRALLALGAKLDATHRSTGQTALMWAAAQGHSEVVRVLAEHGAAVDVRSRSSRRLFNMGSADDGDSIPGELLQTVETGGSTALLFAARHGHIECARVLLDFGANVDDTAADGNSALVVAAHSGQGPFAAFLMDRGANPNADGAGYTVLHAAVLRDDLNLVKASLAHGANPNIGFTRGTPVRRVGPDFFLPADLVGATPFLLAAKWASVEIMRALVAGGADPRLATRDGTTPLIAAADSDRRRQGTFNFAQPGDMIVADERQALEAVTLLLDLGADVNAANQAGDTALHIAAAGKSDLIVQALAERGAKLDVKNQLGRTPLALASRRRQRPDGADDRSRGNSTADLLRKLGAKE